MTPPRRGPTTPARTPALAGVVLCVALLAGCAAPPQLAQLQSDWPSGLPARTLLTRVPFIPQDDFLCGPATLAMVSQAAGRPVSAEQLTPQVYLPGRQGALQTEMLAAARRQGLVAYPLAPDLRTLLTEVAAGEPVLVLQNLSLPIAPQWHYAVAVGYDRARDEIVLHSGTTPRMPMALPTFERTWARSGYWAVRVTAPDRLPATADADGWANAVAALERSDVPAAHVAYRTGLRRWSNHRILMLGLGNTHYAQGRRDQAAVAYAAAVRAHPDFADAWNNLAQVRLELGQLPQAREAVRRAVALGGPRQADYLKLQATIDARRQP